MNISNIIQIFIGLVAFGALIISLLPYRPIKPEIHGRIVSLVVSPSEKFSYEDKNSQNQSIQGVGYSLQASFTVLNKSIIIKDFEVYVKYMNDNKKYLAQTFRATNGYTKNFSNGKKMTLKVPADQELLYINSLEKDKINVYFMNFIVPGVKFGEIKTAPNFEEIEVRFYDFNKKSYSTTFYFRDIDPKKMFFNEELWRDSDS